MWYVSSELEKKKCSVTTALCVSLSLPTEQRLYTLHLSKSCFFFSFTALSFCCVSLAAWLCHSVFSQHIGLLRCPFLSQESTALGDHVKKTTQSLPSVCLWERVCIGVCLFAQCAHPCVCASICGVVLPFPVLGMFKASSCAVRMCLSLFSKNTCSAFYQRAELGWSGPARRCAGVSMDY